ncbi:hypothetical protein [Serratia fonticola]|nr:hypothetical protein [Serratia fonticola]
MLTVKQIDAAQTKLPARRCSNTHFIERIFLMAEDHPLVRDDVV